MKSAHALVAAARGRITELSVQDAKAAIPDAAAVIDVRESDEFAAAHIPGAIHMSRGMLEFKIDNFPSLQSRDLKLIVYCKTGGRAALAARALQDMGYLDVASICGGMDAWLAAGETIAKASLPSFE